MQTWRQRVASILDWSDVDKSIALMFMLIAILLNYIIGNVVLLNISMSTELIYAKPTHQLITYQLIFIIGALLIITAGWHIRIKHPNALWIQYLASNYYSFALIHSSYYIGTISFSTGVVLLGAPVFGFIMGNRRVIWVATIVSVITLLIVTYCALFGFIPYAPLVVPPTTQITHLIWTSLFIWFAAPHFLMIILFTDQVVSYWHSRENMIKLLSHTDMLTGISNRHSLMEHIRNEIARAQRSHCSLTIVLIDLDHFKRINDTWGHPAGDMVLKKAASIFKAQIRQCDMVGRYGGEEFMMILPDTALSGAAILIERCRATLANTVIIADNGERIAVSASFGLASNDKQLALSADELIKQADNALYQAKANGRNRVELAK